MTKQKKGCAKNSKRLVGKTDKQRNERRNERESTRVAHVGIVVWCVCVGSLGSVATAQSTVQDDC
jgi:hypothetical protein